jgi:hypothetical protein
MRRRDESLEPVSHLYELRETSFAGLGVFALQDIPPDTPLLATNLIPISVILRQYRREVCTRCFGYERGRNLKYRNIDVNFSFCSQYCHAAWNEETSDVEKEAWTVVETFIKTKAGKGIRAAVNNSSAAKDDDGDIIVGDEPQRPQSEAIEAVWASIEDTAHFIRQARNGSSLKPHRRALDAALQMLPEADVLYFLLAGILCHAKSKSSDTPADKQLWRGVLALSPDITSYPSIDALRRHCYSYLQLLALIPRSLLPSVTAMICRETASRDAHNAFGIRSLEDEGSEFFGWGIWPLASYFNHSCAPNVAKRREGRTWHFTAGEIIARGEELCISYLGGEEARLSMKERYKSLEIWGFDCSCVKCLNDFSKLDA